MRLRNITVDGIARMTALEPSVELENARNAPQMILIWSLRTYVSVTVTWLHRIRGKEAAKMMEVAKITGKFAC